MLIGNALRDLSNHFRAGAKMALEAEIQCEIRRGFVAGDAGCERLERLIRQRARLMREMARASAR